MSFSFFKPKDKLHWRKPNFNPKRLTRSFLKVKNYPKLASLTGFFRVSIRLRLTRPWTGWL